MAFRVRATLAVALLLALPLQASAQDYPSRPITFVVAFAAGGVADSIGRLVGQRLAETLGHSVVVENRGGAGGNIAAKQIAGAAPDGHAVLVTTTALAISETLHANKGFAASDLTAVAIAASSPESFAVHPSKTAASLKEFLADTKGKTISFGSAGIGSGSHIAAEYFFKEIAKVPATHVPFQGGAPALNAVAGNHIDLVSITLGGGLVAQIKSGTLKGLAVAGDRRIDATPEVPTFGEAGFANFRAASWVGFFVPARTPAAVTAKLNAAIDDIVKRPETQQRLAALGFEPVTCDQGEADKRFRAEIAQWGRMVTALGLKAE